MDAKKAELRQKIIAAVYLGICFEVLFTGYAPSVNYTTTLAGASGELSLALVYANIAFWSFFATSIIRFLGLRLSFVLSSATYVGFTVSVLSRNDVFLYIASAFLGLGAAVLWVGQGLYLKQISEDAPAGYLTGIFFAVYTIYDLTGNGIASLLLLMDNDVDVVLTVVTFVGVGAVVLFAFVPSRGLPVWNASNTVSVQERVRRTFMVMKDDKLKWMIPYMVTQGVNMGFSLGSFLALIGALSENAVSYVSFCYGIVTMFVAPLAGKIIDRPRGWVWIVSTHVVLVLLTYGLTVWANHDDDLTLYYIAGSLFGISNASLQVLINTSIIQNFKDAQPAFQAFRFVNAVSFASGFLVGVFGGFIASVSLACVLTTIGAICFTYLYVSVLPALAAAEPQPRASIDESDSQTYGAAVDGSIALDGGRSEASSQRSSATSTSTQQHTLLSSDSHSSSSNGAVGSVSVADSDKLALLPKSTTLSD